MNEINKVVYYPIFFTPYITMQHDILVYIPDFNIYTEGYDIENAIKMAKDAIINTLSETKELIKPSGVSEAYKKASEDADEIFDFSKDGMLTFVKIDISELPHISDSKNEKDQKDIAYNILEVLISFMFDNKPFNVIINELKERGCYSKDLELMIRRRYNKKNFIDSMNSLSESDMFEPRSKFND